MGLLYQHGGGTGRRQAASLAQRLVSLIQMERSRSARYFVLKSKQKQTGRKQSQRPEAWSMKCFIQKHDDVLPIYGTGVPVLSEYDPGL